MKTYTGTITSDGAIVLVDGRPLNPRLDLANKSPTGFAWGYGGSGPGQLALAILADFLQDDDAALDLYQDFKWHVIAALDGDWSLTSDQIESVIRSIAQNRSFPGAPLDPPAAGSRGADKA